MSGKRILFIGGNFSPELTGIGKYNGEMMAWLSKKGYQCTVVTTYPYYPSWKVQEPYRSNKWFHKAVYFPEEGTTPLIVYRCPHYIPGNPTGAKRVVSEISFTISSFVVILSMLFRKRFDYVMVVAPPFQIGLLGILYKKIKKARLLYHIQDLQVDAARDLSMIKSKILLKCLFRIEKFILKQSDVLSTISAGMVNKVKQKCNREILLFPNWVDMNVFYPIEKMDLKEKFGFAKTDRIIMYSGAIGEKQGIEAILHAAIAMRNSLTIKFVICGSGPYKEKLEAQKAKMGLLNVFFFPLQPAGLFNDFLNIADVHLVLQKAGASDLVMPSKLSTILAIGGLAIVTAVKESSLFEAIKQDNMGILIEPENQDALNTAIEQALSTDTAHLRTNACRYAQKFLSRDRILFQYISKGLGFHQNKREQVVLHSAAQYLESIES